MVHDCFWKVGLPIIGVTAPCTCCWLKFSTLGFKIVQFSLKPRFLPPFGRFRMTLFFLPDCTGLNECVASSKSLLLVVMNGRLSPKGSVCCCVLIFTSPQAKRFSSSRLGFLCITFVTTRRTSLPRVYFYSAPETFVSAIF